MVGLSDTSRRRLYECDERLVDLVVSVAEHIPLVVVCGFRGEHAQREAVRTGHSRVEWPSSKHNATPSLAVDLAPLTAEETINWRDREAFAFLAGAMCYLARARGVPLVWGGEWRSFPDLPHFELST